MYFFISYTMLHNPNTHAKYFKNISIFKNLFKVCFRPTRSTVAVSGQLGRPAGRPGPFGRGRSCCACLPVDQVGRPTAWPLLLGCAGRPGRSTDRTKIYFHFAWRSTGQLTGANSNFVRWPAGRPAAVQIHPTALFWICFVFYGFQQLFLVS